MYIKMEYLQKELGNKITQSHIPNDSHLLSFKLYETTIREFQDNILHGIRPV